MAAYLVMPIPRDNAFTALVDGPRLQAALLATGRFNYLVTIQSFTVAKSSTGDPTYTWANVPTMTSIPCRRHDRIPNEARTLEVIEEDKYFTIMLNGFFPAILPQWRARIDDPDLGLQIYDVVGADSDSQHLLTVLTCKIIFPIAKAGT